ncbi:GNAT family N-acetyltransferase [Polyangium aurulentum]|uniref:GNAT family N-acetyltransferase n=1 Tax=Polyangium aurulentum TaxID=2567896 RepID=UPI0010ADEBAF|nr:GNAT family N-acetyltransferase [Polyangium aurulentum]UQA55420.1 GNAT family N-acetyltransferase [Polyangium aurulentum]
MRGELRERPALASDYDRFARLFPELGTGDPVPGRARWEEEMRPSTIFLERDGEIVAYGYTQALHGTGYVRHVIVAPGERGKGVGRVLMRALGRQLAAAGCTRWCLNVKPDNEPGIRLYSACGMRVAYASTAFRLKWDVLERLPREAEAPSVHSVEPGDDAEIEATFDLPTGQIADVRARGGRVLMRLATSEGLGGFASFDPRFPGAFPFRVVRPSLAVHLLEAMRLHTPPEHDHTSCVAEDAPALRDALVAAGAEVRFEMFHMKGPIPAELVP